MKSGNVEVRPLSAPHTGAYDSATAAPLATPYLSMVQLNYFFSLDFLVTNIGRKIAALQSGGSEGGNAQ
jgi:hypothetical protein